MSAGAGDRRIRPTQSTSLAVVTTLVALLLALGVSVTVSRRSTLVTTAGTTIPAKASMASTASPAAAPRGGPVRSGQAAASKAEGQGAPSPAPQAPPATEDSGQQRGRPEKATKPAPTERMQLRRAAPGGWDVRVERASSSVLGSTERADTRFAVTDLDDGSQRVALETSVLALAHEVVRYDPRGRRLHELVIEGAGDEPVVFRSAEGLADVPAEFSTGDAWEWHAETDDRRTSLAGKLQVAGREPPPATEEAAGPARSDVVRYTLELAIGGDRSITITRTVWFAAELGLPVRVEERAQGTDPSGKVVDSTATLTLRSRPATAGKGNRTVENPAAP